VKKFCNWEIGKHVKIVLDHINMALELMIRKIVSENKFKRKRGICMK
jgi:hypothetical protein